MASGDPDPHGVLLWTRRPFAQGTRELLTVRSPRTRRSIVSLRRRRHRSRFTDADGNGSRVGRTITATLPDDPRSVNFAFVSCQDVNEGKLNAYRRMIHEDERAPAAEQLGFVLHLGDFICEVVEYPEEVKTRDDRTIHEVARILAATRSATSTSR